MKYISAIAVGGPFAGKLIPLDVVASSIPVFKWPEPKRMEPVASWASEQLRSDPYVLHTYKWKEVVIASNVFEARCCAMVHGSFEETKDIQRAVIASVISLILVEGLK